ncbi:BPTD_3080 family restriction endonuclease [Leptospira sp. GIMC2001]|uniref:BPTD_3080 family restriction endonuclease n=1 Tax=Leptospira sp. GIMC2001 TaxID=1513297 RepID=UPI00234A262F|nr:DEAD/DEAH box helicase family protein [Leptospira sp. GIMC2001]WCL50751.1 DEAD/DEAH box helicase family protein [Leptospira sp. GIMC2001]
MAEHDFFEKPIINSPYRIPDKHWELDDAGQPTGSLENRRRIVKFVTPIPKPKRNTNKKKSQGQQVDLGFTDKDELSEEKQKYDIADIIGEVRNQVDAWRQLSKSQWGVTPETARLLEHWRKEEWDNIRPFFCQVEAMEVAIWLHEVAPSLKNNASIRILRHLSAANENANPDLFRIALKLATGSGKTTVMAMMIAWQTVNSVRMPNSKRYTRGFLVVSPGLTIKDRLRVLQPHDPSSYFLTRDIVPTDMLDEIKKARIVITNYHAFKRRETMDISKAGRSFLQGPHESMETLETEGQMLQRVLPELMGMKSVIVLNDEAHHCYREKPESDEDMDDLDTEAKADLRDEAKKNNEAARLWISGLEALNRKIKVTAVYDLSATPFFLRGSGYVEGTLFPWTVSDFSLMDAIECGIVKLPRVPIDDNIPENDMPIYRNLWENIRKDMPKKGRAKAEDLDPNQLPTRLQTAIESLYGHYEQVFKLWVEENTQVPPCFIVVCQNTSISKLVYDYVSGFRYKTTSGLENFQNGKLKLFRNFDDSGNPFPRPNTILIDSEALESGESIDKNFREYASDEIERFRRELVERSGNAQAGENLKDEELLREVMNTVGKPNTLGGQVRCVVSVSMLTEGWDANNVTHILGIRAFGTQLLCEQVVGRALRRQSYMLNEEGLMEPEYADIFGIPFDFTAKPVISKPKKPVDPVTVCAVRPERDKLEIQFPKVEGYRTDLPREEIEAEFDTESKMILSPELVGATITQNSGIIGETANLRLEDAHLDTRPSTVIYNITLHLIQKYYKDGNEDPKFHLFNQIKDIVRDWIDGYLECKNGTSPGQLMYLELADMAAEKISRAITKKNLDKQPIKVVLDPYNPKSSTTHVRFITTSQNRYRTDPRKSQINYVIYDSTWEAEFTRVLEATPEVLCYVKNHGLGFEVPYRMGTVSKKYRPDFIVLIDQGSGMQDPLKLVVEVKGFKGEDAREKKGTMETYWVPGVNRLGNMGRWDFLELDAVHEMDPKFQEKIQSALKSKTKK